MFVYSWSFHDFFERLTNVVALSISIIVSRFILLLIEEAIFSWNWAILKVFDFS